MAAGLRTSSVPFQAANATAKSSSESNSVSFGRVEASSRVLGSSLGKSSRGRCCQGGEKIEQGSSRVFDSRNGESGRKNNSSEVLELINSTAAAGSRPWWSPLFDFSGEVYDFDDAGGGGGGGGGGSGGGSGGDEIRSGIEEAREAPLEPAEKFKLLRARLSESESWHDTMYHSAIASRLATKRPD